MLLASQAMAQETLSLAQCLQMGIERNLNLKTYEGNVLKGKHNISENRSRLLPQINIGAALNDNFTPPVSVTDGRAYGKPYNVTKTLQYNSSASLQLQMPLYSQTASHGARDIEDARPAQFALLREGTRGPHRADKQDVLLSAEH